MNLLSDKERFVGVLKENKGILWKVIRSYCKDADEWKDLEQDIVVQLWKSFKNYNDQYKLSTWIYRIALNVAISYYRKDLKRKDHTALDESILVVVDDESDGEMNTRKQLLYSFISSLDKFNKAIIILHLDDHSHKEIAEILGITETNVGTKINRIKNKFKTYYQLQS